MEVTIAIISGSPREVLEDDVVVGSFREVEDDVVVEVEDDVVVEVSFVVEDDVVVGKASDTPISLFPIGMGT